MATTVFFGALVILSSMALSVLGLLIVQRLVPLSLRESHNVATGTVYAAVYVMFGVTLAFSLYLVWHLYDAAQKTAESEASSVEEIYRLAGSFPEPERSEVQELAASYASVVAGEEWPLMREGRTSPRAAELVVDLRSAIQDFEPRSPAQGALRGEGLEQMDELDDDRALRLLEVREGLPRLVWVVLVVGGVVTVSFTFLFGMETPWVHMLTVAALALLVSLVVYTIAVLEYPFDGGMGVDADAFELVMQRIEGSDR